MISYSIGTAPVFASQGWIMEVRTESKDGSPVASPARLVDNLVAQLRAEQKGWVGQLSADPGSFAQLEVAVHQRFQQMADQLVASLLMQATQASPALDDAKKK
jgi:hypothetical protein